MHKKQHTLWLLAALAAPLAHFSGSGWLTAVLACAAVLPLTLLPKSWTGMPKPMALIQICWLGAVAGAFLSGSAAYWPSDNNLAVPLTILALAALTNAAAASRIGAVLALCMALPAIPAAVSGAAHLEPAWLRPAIGSWPWGLTLALLLPNLPAAKPGERRGTGYSGLLAVTVSALVQGTISSKVAASVPDPFYQTARTLGYLEPVIAAAVTLGWYALTVYLFQSVTIIAKESRITSKWSTVLAVGTATGSVILGVQPLQPLWSLFGVFLWVFTPFLTKIKKVEKT